LIFEKKNFSKELFKDLKNYRKYIIENKIDKKLNIDIKKYGNIKKKTQQNQYYTVAKKIKNPFPAELDDLCRLYYLVISRKVNTILEFGTGKSTVVFNYGLIQNKIRFKNYVNKNLRIPNSFLCFSLDSFKSWVKKVKSEYKLKNVKFHISGLRMDKFNGRICTFYNKLPNICPDLIYLDGPDLYSTKGNINGISTKGLDRLPMAGDILLIEHFLLPGTLIVVDGRTANARFLKCNFQRDWIYCHDVKNDQHFFELCEKPLGIHNNKQIKHCLGKNYFKRLISLQNKK
tara:strand:+ start:131 stop:994 length:864 start_codon:yes stop_codon:yes gene_type:complete